MKLSKTRQKSYIRQYINSNKTSIYEAYRNPSIYKVRSYNDLIKKYSSGYCRLFGYKILGYNSSTYTMGFVIYNYIDNELQLIIETYQNTYTINITSIQDYL